MREEKKGMVAPMSFTQDELQALNTIIEQKLSLQRRELERTFDQRLHILRRDFEQQLTALQQDLLRNLSRRFSDQQNRLREAIQHKLDSQQTRLAQIIAHEIEQKQPRQQQQLADLIERSLAAQLLAFEQLINQRLPTSGLELSSVYANEQQTEFDAIEVQTEIPWEDLVELIDKVLDERLSLLNASLVARTGEMERALLGQIQQMLDTLIHEQTPGYSKSKNTILTNTEDVFNSIEQLEHIVESMQMAMTANSTLLSNRLYHHQQLPLERAHSNRYTISFHEKSEHEEGSSLPPVRQQDEQPETLENET